MNVVTQAMPPSQGAGTTPASSTPLVTPLHVSVPGRVRLRVSGLRGDRRLAVDIGARLRSLPGIIGVVADPVTGNVLVRFDRALDVVSVVAEAERQVRAAAGPPPVCGRHAPSPPPARLLSRRADRTPIPSSRPPASSRRPDAESNGGDWHLRDVMEVLAAVDVCPEVGLTAGEAGNRCARFGANTLPKASRRSSLAIVIEQFRSLPIALLAGSAVLSLATGGAADAVVILGVVAINAAIGYATEAEAEATIAAMIEPQVTSARVRRDGHARSVAIADIVVGDILPLEPGSFIAADGRLIEASDLTIDESLLTGESMPVAKTPERLTGPLVALGDRRNMLYRGTAVTGGSGVAVVVATAADTEIGRIQALVGTATTPTTPMQAQLDRIGNRLVWTSAAICAFVCVLGIARGQGLLPMIRSAISLAVAAVPEGLPTIATTTLALGVRRMRGRRVLVRRLDAIETLGAVQVMCFDKTGTLTLNRIAVAAVHCNGLDMLWDGGALRSGGAPIAESASELQELLRVAVLCNDCQIGDGDDNGRALLTGSPTEAALLRLAIDLGVDVVALRRQYPLISADYRTEQRAYMQTVHVDPSRGLLIAVKGSPEIVLGLCAFEANGGFQHPLTDARRQAIIAANERMGGEALRVLGFAYGHPDDDCEGEVADVPLTWLGLVGMADPVRDGMDALMSTLQGAGVDTVMITGDQSATAYAVARRLGLGRGGRTEILDSSRIDNLSPDVLTALARRADVFARVSPANKLQIVQALQRGGEVVAMTGDGINDSPALKAADIGVAMGRSGTDVAREVADIVLEDDDPATFATAIAEGRTIYNNVRKSLRFLLATNMSEIVVMVGGTAFGRGSVLTPMQLLWINLMTDVFPALALALEPTEHDVMLEPPRPPEEAILRRGDFRRILMEGSAISCGALAACTWGNLRYGPGAPAGTVTLSALILSQLMHALTCRSERNGLFTNGRPPPNPWMRRALVGSVLVQAMAFVVPSLRRLLGLGAIDGADALVIAVSGLAPYLAIEAAKCRDDAPLTSASGPGETAGAAAR